MFAVPLGEWYFIERGPCRKSQRSTMISLLVRISLALLVLNQLLTPADAFEGYNRGSGYSNYNKGYETPGRPKTFVGNSLGLPSQHPTRRGLGISAWGIVIVIVAIILAVMGLYYFSICYSVCQPTKSKYDKMGLPSIA